MLRIVHVRAVYVRVVRVGVVHVDHDVVHVKGGAC